MAGIAVNTAVNIPTIVNDDPNAAALNYNTLVGQINAAFNANFGTQVPAPQFTSTAGLQTATLATQLAILIELRCINNILTAQQGVFALDQSQMRADELSVLSAIPAVF
jgi:hypothetical protein